MFCQHFVAGLKRKREAIYLTTIKQGRNESLRAYIKRFNEAMLEVDELNCSNIVDSLINGTTCGDFMRRLMTKPPRTISAVMSTADVYINAAEMEAWREAGPASKKKEEKPVQGPGQQSNGQRRDRPPQPPRRFADFTPLNATRSDIFLQIQKDGLLTEPTKLRAPPESRDRRRFCDFHRDHGHTTEECASLKQQIEALIQKGELRQYTAGGRQGGRRGNQQNDNRGNNRNNNNDARERAPNNERVIHTITGGRDIPGRRSYVGNVNLKPADQEDDCAITFSNDDLKGLNAEYDDSLVIKAKVAECTVRRILVDTGSSADIIFWNCFEKMGIDRNLLRASTSPLTGFTGHQARVMGKICLPVQVGNEPGPTKTIQADFIIVNAPSAYNMIFGMPSLVDMKAVVSPFFQVIKFPTAAGVGRISCEQGRGQEVLYRLPEGGQPLLGHQPLKLSLTARQRQAHPPALSNNVASQDALP